MGGLNTLLSTLSYLCSWHRNRTDRRHTDRRGLDAGEHWEQQVSADATPHRL
jgi:hypothetical protein